MWLSIIVLQSLLICGARLSVSFHECPFICKNRRCVPESELCDGRNNCKDGSDEEVCGPDCPQLSYQCWDKSGCYFYSKKCDGPLDCSDGSDEEGCWSRPCHAGRLRCLHGACVTTRDACCPTFRGFCDRYLYNDSRETMNKTLVFVDGDYLYSLNMADNSKKPLHRQANSTIAAVTYSPETGTIFWVVENEIWHVALTAGEGAGQVFGRIGNRCNVSHMAYDWITGNFYLACEYSGLQVCSLRTGTTDMLCTRQMDFGILEYIQWLDFDPNAGRVLVGSTVTSRLRIFGADGDGRALKLVFESHPKRRINPSQLCRDKNEILILGTYLRGNLSSINISNGTERLITHDLITDYSEVLALFPDVAVFYHSKGNYALFFWWVFRAVVPALTNIIENVDQIRALSINTLTFNPSVPPAFRNERKVVKQKELNISSGSRLFTLIEEQPMSENRCKNLNCTQLCLLIPDGAVCACDFRYQLMEDGQTCIAREMAKIEGELNSPNTHSVSSA